MQSGKPVGVFRTHADAPRVLIANSNLVGRWSTWDHFHELDRKGLMMYGQMTAGSWIYIGSQGIVQGTYETFVEMGRQHYGGDLAGRWILTAGLGGMGGAQPLAATMAALRCSRSSAGPSGSRSGSTRGYLDCARTRSTRRSRRSRARPATARRSRSACSATRPRCCPSCCAAACDPDAVTDQTSAHDPVNGYLPAGWTLEQWDRQRASDPRAVETAARRSMARHVEAMLAFQRRGIPTFDYGNNIRQVALDEGVKDAFAFPGFVPAYVRPLFCRGVGPFRWVALSGDPEDIHRTDARVKELIPGRSAPASLARPGARIVFSSRACRRGSAGWASASATGSVSPSTRWCARGELKAPVVIGRDHLDSRHRSRAPTARRKRCATARTRSPTGRS